MVRRSGQRCSQDLRDRVLSAVNGGMAVSPSCIYKALMRRRPTGDSGPDPNRGHAPPVPEAPYQTGT